MKTITKLFEFFKSEFSGWKRFETVTLVSIFIFILFNAFFVKDSVIAVISAICGILYSSFAGKGKVSCYIFGMTGSGCYSYLSWVNGLYGNLILYLCYYIPMQAFGLFSWSRNLKTDKKEIVKTQLNNKQRVVLFSLAIVVSALAFVVLKFLNGSSPFFDGITTVLSVLGMYLTVKRCIEQWVVWMIVNGLSSLMWLNLVMHGAKTYATFIMWVVYFVLSVYFYFVWRKELSEKHLDQNQC